MTKISHRPSTKIEVRPVKGKGRGVVAVAPLRRGQIVERSPVLLVPSDESDRLVDSFLGSYIFQTDDGQRHAIALGFASLYNHSDAANAEFSVSRREIVITATRAIAKGEEITIDYGWTPEEWEQVGVRPKP